MTSLTLPTVWATGNISPTEDTGEAIAQALVLRGGAEANVQPIEAESVVIGLYVYMKEVEFSGSNIEDQRGSYYIHIAMQGNDSDGYWAGVANWYLSSVDKDTVQGEFPHLSDAQAKALAPMLNRMLKVASKLEMSRRQKVRGLLADHRLSGLKELTDLLKQRAEGATTGGDAKPGLKLKLRAE